MIMVGVTMTGWLEASYGYRDKCGAGMIIPYQPSFSLSAGTAEAPTGYNTRAASFSTTLWNTNVLFTKASTQ